MPNHRVVEKICKGCGKKKKMQARVDCCSNACGAEYRKRNLADARAEAGAIVTGNVEGIDDAVLRLIRKKKDATLDDIADNLDRGPGVVLGAVERLRAAGYQVKQSESRRGGFVLDAVSLARDTIAITHDTREYEGKWLRFGVCGDKHMGNMQSRLDVMELLYKLFAAEGISTVYDTGNWIDGEARFNKSELLVHGMDNQLDYWIDNHPKHDGIKTYFVAGDDHEGWYQQRESLEIGKYAMLRARDQGRDDLIYLGYAEARIELKAAKGSRIMMVNHPGGGSAYSISYKGQKYVESLQGGEKPAIVLQGHYHKFNYGYPREVHVVDTATCCDQTLFMRKRMLQAHVGGQIIELMQAPDGRITRFRVEFLPFYDRGFYDHNCRRFGIPAARKRAA